MPPKPGNSIKLFLSTVSAEFEAYRLAVKGALVGPRIDVKEGESVGAADVVGLVGATGRVTGPHLHWALRAGRARIDPLSALELLGSAKSRQP
jgi:hypothetical protein